MAHDTSLESVGDLVEFWQRVDSASPRLTWYGADGERVELSGRVLANWVVKATNLLTEEAVAGPGVVVGVDLPVHWRALVWSLATLQAGAAVNLAGEGGADPVPRAEAGGPEADTVVTDRPVGAHQRVRAGGSVIAVALPALARAFEGTLDRGVIDGAADLMTYPDVLALPPDVDPDAPAVEDATHAGLLAWARRVAASAPVPGAGRPASEDLPGSPTSGPRALVTATDQRVVLATALAVWAEGGSVVLVAGERSDAELARLADVETATR
ncbi:TIGR03089 family protein [Occultella glacieicola]|uniref:TIGR03089 family protein n=1 Tax=Occultella glacieicola TaxID=2518684 RepID=A0ABY2E6B2_9MICO|nr:TIGR03089 family protein [Occultella glacieicola]TDE96128.1 TIGR03089 family protein [Occultella glacieicola]